MQDTTVISPHSMDGTLYFVKKRIAPGFDEPGINVGKCFGDASCPSPQTQATKLIKEARNG
jgi:hypothetical protein